ncbi:MAG: hypothetical protein ACO3CJ_09845, partial [Burkholderiaceae bacterium]
MVGPQGLVAHGGQDSYSLWMPVRAASVEEAYGSWRQLSRQLIPTVTVLHASVPIQPCSGVAALAMTA